MIKKLKNKENKSKNNSIIDCILEIQQKFYQNKPKIKSSNRNLNKKIEKEIRKLKKEKNLAENYFNGQNFPAKTQSSIERDFDDKENINKINNSNLFYTNRNSEINSINNKFKLSKASTRHNSISIHENFNINKNLSSLKTPKIFELEEKEIINNNTNTTNNIKTTNINLNFKLDLIKSNSNKFIYSKEIEFFDELNYSRRIMHLFEEKYFKIFETSNKNLIMPSVKIMKIDNDILSEDEQINDAFKMLMNNLKDSIKLGKKNKNYFEDNLSHIPKVYNLEIDKSQL
jgi:hypothetical protein